MLATRKRRIASKKWWPSIFTHICSATISPPQVPVSVLVRVCVCGCLCDAGVVKDSFRAAAEQNKLSLFPPEYGQHLNSGWLMWMRRFDQITDLEYCGETMWFIFIKLDNDGLKDEDYRLLETGLWQSCPLLDTWGIKSTALKCRGRIWNLDLHRHGFPVTQAGLSALCNITANINRVSFYPLNTESLNLLNQLVWLLPSVTVFVYANTLILLKFASMFSLWGKTSWNKLGNT